MYKIKRFSIYTKLFADGAANTLQGLETARNNLLSNTSMDPKRKERLLNEINKQISSLRGVPAPSSPVTQAASNTTANSGTKTTENLLQKGKNAFNKMGTAGKVATVGVGLLTAGGLGWAASNSMKQKAASETLCIKNFSRIDRIHKEAVALFNQGKHGEALKTLERYSDMARKGSTDALKSASLSDNPVKIWEVTKGVEKSSKRIKDMMNSINIPGKVGKNKPLKVKDGGIYDPKPLIQVTDYGKVNKVPKNKNKYLGSDIHINNY